MASLPTICMQTFCSQIKQAVCLAHACGLLAKKCVEEMHFCWKTDDLTRRRLQALPKPVMMCLFVRFGISGDWACKMAKVLCLP